MTIADLKRRLRELRHAVGQCLSRLDAMDVRLAELERAQRRDVARDHASPYVCANQEKK